MVFISIEAASTVSLCLEEKSVRGLVMEGLDFTLQVVTVSLKVQ